MKKIHILAAFSAMLMVAGCVYEFNPDLSDRDLITKLVVFADIVESPQESEITISSTIPLTYDPNDKNAKYPSLSVVSLKIEDDNGRVEVIDPETSKVLLKEGAVIHRFYFDFPSISNDRNYRVETVVNLDGRVLTAQSDWIKPIETASIDSLYYERYDEREVRILADVSADASDSQPAYFKWDFHEDWEIMSVMTADLYFDEPQDKLIKFEPEEYGKWTYCWKESDCNDIIIGSTSDMARPELKHQQIKSIYSMDDRLSLLYRIEVRLSQISSEAYMYWHTLRENSENIGGLFSPQPTEFAGNFSCISDPSEKVLGYAGISKTTSRILYISRSRNLDISDMYRFPKADSLVNNSYFAGEDTPTPTDHEMYYDYGMWPVLAPEITMDEDDIAGRASWVFDRSCADCRALGGTKNRPSNWPSNNW